MGDPISTLDSSLPVTGMQSEEWQTSQSISWGFFPQNFYCYANANHNFLSTDPFNSLEHSIHPFTNSSSELRPNKKYHQVIRESSGVQAAEVVKSFILICNKTPQQYTSRFPNSHVRHL